MTSLVQPDALARLRAELGGGVIGPGDGGYDAARTIFPGGFDGRPAAITRPPDASQVARSVQLARELGLDVAVRSGGHSGAGHSAWTDSLVIDLRDMRALDIDVEGRTAWAQAGLTAGEYTNAVGEHGLATGFGDTGSVGIGGLTLGGGVGYLSRLHGLTVDDLLAAEIVTADGEVLEVDAESHPDLFWAIRGGGGNFGVATRFRYRLHELPTVVGGILILPASAEVLTSFLAESEAAPDELSAIVSVMPAPPMPFVPEELHGEVVVMALMCFAGDVEAGERALAPFRALAEPLADMVRPIPYPEIYPPDPEDFHPVAAVRTMFVDSVDQGVAEGVIERVRASDAQMRVAQFRVLGGAIARVPVDATAYPHRTSKIMANVAAFVSDPDERPVREAWVDEFMGDLRQTDAGAYVNFLSDEGTERVRAAYPGATWDRLVEVKKRYDPDNVFKLNQNIPPS